MRNIGIYKQRIRNLYCHNIQKGSELLFNFFWQENSNKDKNKQQLEKNEFTISNKCSEDCRFSIFVNFEENIVTADLKIEFSFSK
jgi:hypothetical protein